VEGYSPNMGCTSYITLKCNNSELGIIVEISRANIRPNNLFLPRSRFNPAFSAGVFIVFGTSNFITIF